MTILFLSPHYDDAVYSCGGTIYQLCQAGEDVTILTIMAGLPPENLPDSPIVRDVHERWALGENPVQKRRQEDQKAAAVLGVKTQYLAIPDCIYRLHEGTALYPDEDSLWGSVHPNDPALEVLAKLDLGKPRAIYAPLAVGRHVDHQLVRNWALNLQKQADALFFYEDYPYLRNRALVKSALDAFHLPMQSEEQFLSELAMNNKIAAMEAYESQISSFWKNKDAIAPEVRQTYAHANAYAERYWRFEK